MAFAKKNDAAKKAPAKGKTTPAAKGKIEKGSDGAEKGKAAFVNSAKKKEKTWKEARTKGDQGFSSVNAKVGDGLFTAAITAGRMGAFPAKNDKPETPYVGLTATIIDHPKLEGQKLNILLSFGEKNIEFSVRQLTACGFDLSELEVSEVPELVDAILEPKDDKGKVIPGARTIVQIKVENKTYQGNPQQNVYIQKPLTK